MGGMGEVYLAEDTRLNRRVALKFLPARFSDNDDIYTRFVREARIPLRLNHPDVVSIYDVNNLDNRPFYATELIEGEVLHRYCHARPLPVDTMIVYAIRKCQGLGEAHRAGIIHRDVKSTNIIVDKNGRCTSLILVWRLTIRMRS